MPGVELGGALKNVLAIGCGISDGLGFGCNGRAALITRGLSEMTRLAVALGAHPLTMQGLAGMGDLVLTCTGPPCSTATLLAEDLLTSSAQAMRQHGSHHVKGLLLDCLFLMVAGSPCTAVYLVILRSSTFKTLCIGLDLASIMLQQ